MTWFFTADWHLDHSNIISYCDRPFTGIEHMKTVLIENFNSKVKSQDVTVFAGDLTLHTNPKIVESYFTQHLNGSIIFLKGNHDYWMKQKRYMYHRHINNQLIVVSHYPMRTWKNSNHGSWNLHGHSHGKLLPLFNQLDIGIDSHNYFPLSFDEIKKIMEAQPK
jgi:calcineurin-like phosphoesterase family protein